MRELVAPLIAGLGLAVSLAPLCAQTIPIDTMGRGTISAPGTANYQGSFSADGRTWYFFRRVAPGENYRIFRSARLASGWGVPERVDLGGEFSDLYPTVSRDGRTLVFASYRPVPGHPDWPRQAYLYRSERTATGWGPPQLLEHLSRPGFYHSGVQLDTRGALRWVRSGRGTRERMIAPALGASFGEPVLDSLHLEWAARAPAGHVFWSVVFSPDTTLAILGISARDSAGRDRPSDLWISARQGNGWTMPVPLPAEINGPGWENFPAFAPDGREMHFNKDFLAFHTVRVADLRRFITAAAAGDGPDGTELARVPFRLMYDRIVVPVFVNERGPYRFMIDLGATGLGRIDSTLTERLALPRGPTVPNSDGINTRQTPTAVVGTLRLASLTRRVSAPLITRGYNRGRVPADTAFYDGILGLDFFSDVVLTIDYANRELRLATGRLERADAGVIPFDGDQIRLPLTIDGHAAAGMLDTGSSLHLHMPASWVARLNLSNLREGPVARRANTEYRLRYSLTPIPVRIGNLEIMVSRTDFSDLVPDINVGSRLLVEAGVELTVDQRSGLVRLRGPR